jgi:hypothetical protein
LTGGDSSTKPLSKLITPPLYQSLADRYSPPTAHAAMSTPPHTPGA